MCVVLQQALERADGQSNQMDFRPTAVSLEVGRGFDDSQVAVMFHLTGSRAGKGELSS